MSSFTCTNSWSLELKTDDPNASGMVTAPRRGRRAGPARRLWRAIRGPVAGSAFVRHAASAAVVGAFRFIKATNRVLPGLDEVYRRVAAAEPVIVTLWHGQHLLAPFYLPKDFPCASMVSRSADAEINALTLRRLGVEVLRGSGGRPGAEAAGKGGARALIALKKALDRGINALMIADIPHGVPRQAGLGVVALSRLSGRPILPIAVATSRRKVFRRSWDQTTLNLPFGRVAIVAGDLVAVPREAPDTEMEGWRARLTDALNEATARAYAAADGRP